MMKRITILAAAAAAIISAAVLASPAHASATAYYSHNRSMVEAFTLTSTGGSAAYQAVAEGSLFFGDGTFTQLTSWPDPSFEADIANGTFMVSAFGGQVSRVTSERDCTTSFTVVNMLYTIYQGTGALQGVFGAGNAAVHAVITDAGKPGKCQFTRAVPGARLVTITAEGLLTLPSAKSSR